MLSRTEFLKTMPGVVVPQLPQALQDVKVRQPYRWLVQFHFGEPRLHYEISAAKHRDGWELGFHCESRDKGLNRFLLDGFRRHLFEIKSELGPQVRAEMWDRGWTKIYEVYPDGDLTEAYQQEVAGRLAALIICVQPIFVELRGSHT
jgi:hypothetical protein